MNKSEGHIKISVVVATYQGANRISTVLKSLAEQTFKDFETVVIIDGSTDETEKVLKTIPYPINLRVFTQKNKGRAGARNTGALHASFDYIVFFDDDVEIPDSVLQSYYKMACEGHSVIVGGFYPAQRSKNEFFLFASYLNKKWSTNVNNNAKGYMSEPYISAANFFISKKMFAEFRGFNEELRDAEDFDFAVRLFEAKIPIYFHPEIAVGHYIQSNFMEYVRRLKQYQQAQYILKTKNPAVGKYAKERQSLTPFKRVLFRLLSSDVYVKLIDAGVFSWLPQKVRFKIYDVIITASMLN